VLELHAFRYEQPIELPQFKHLTATNGLATHEASEKQAPNVSNVAVPTGRIAATHVDSDRLVFKDGTKRDDSRAALDRALARALDLATERGDADLIGRILGQLEARRS
jgi:hypothetical protein